MPISDNARTAEALRRKLRALAAVFLDPAATDHEKANAKVLKGRLETQLGQKATSENAWTGIMFRLGRGVREITSSRPAKGDWTDHAFRLGRISAEELGSSDRIRDEARCSGSAVWGTLDSSERWCRFVNGNCLACKRRQALRGDQEHVCRLRVVIQFRRHGVLPEWHFKLGAR
jgi:hypothetical protein